MNSSENTKKGVLMDNICDKILVTITVIFTLYTMGIYFSLNSPKYSEERISKEIRESGILLTQSDFR